MTRHLRLLVAVLAVLSLVAAACAADDDPAVAPETPADPDAEPAGVEAAAASLRADLTHLLNEHVYMAGVAITTALAAGPDSPEAGAAIAALDGNSQALADAVGSIYGAEGGEQFLALWREHIDMFVDYTLARAGGDEAGQQAALDDLDRYRSEFGAFLESATEGNLPADAVAEELVPHVDTVIATIDAAVDGSPEVFDRLRDAASHMPHTARVLAGGIAAQFPDRFPGDVEAPASELRAGLTHLLGEHVYMAGVALSTAVGAGLDAPETAAAVEALDANSQALADAVGSIYGAEGGEQFLALWREHIDMFVDYTLARAGGDEAGQQAALDDLDRYRSEFGAFLESATEGNLPADAVAEELVPHVDTVRAAIDALVDGDAAVFDRLRDAGGHMPHTARVLAGGIVAQFPDRF